MTVRHFLSLEDIPHEVLDGILTQAIAWKNAGCHQQTHVAKGLALACMFDKPSTRTRISFSLAAQQLGMHLVDLETSKMHFSHGKETLEDTARMLNGFVDAVLYRTHSEHAFDELTKQLSIPLINGLSENSHPCQIVADLMTVQEHFGTIDNLTALWVGDYNNVARSWAHAAIGGNFSLRMASPEGFAMSDTEYQALTRQGANITLFRDAIEAAKNVHIISTDVWVSMGDTDSEARLKALSPYQVNAELMSVADKEAIFLHCLPANRGQEVTSDVLDGAQSAAWQQAWNRLHAQKAILAWVLDRL